MDKKAGIAQMVEQLICNHQVPCSIHGAGTKTRAINSVGSECLLYTEEAGGSSPSLPTISEHSAAWQRIWFGTRGSQVRILLLRPPAGVAQW